MKRKKRRNKIVEPTEEEFYEYLKNRLLIGKYRKVKNNTKINGIVNNIRKNTSNVRILNSEVLTNKNSKMTYIDECLKNFKK